MSWFKKISKAHTAPSKDSSSGKSEDAPTPENSPEPETPDTLPNKALAKDMVTYGITRVPVDYYHFGVFRYTNLKDAIEEAKRASQS